MEKLVKVPSGLILAALPFLGCLHCGRIDSPWTIVFLVSQACIAYIFVETVLGKHQLKFFLLNLILRAVP